MSEVNWSALPTFEEGLTDEFSLGFEGGMIYQAVKLMQLGALGPTMGIHCSARVANAEMMMHIGTVLEVHVHSHEVDETWMRCCFIRSSLLGEGVRP